MKFMKKVCVALLAALMAAAFMPAMAFADGNAADGTTDKATGGGTAASEPTGYVTVNDGTEHYNSVDDAIAKGVKADKDGTLTIHIHGTVLASEKSLGQQTTDDAQIITPKTGATNLVIEGNSSSDTLIITGVYSGQINMGNTGTIDINNLTLKDRRNFGVNYDPWEFTYIMPVAKQSTFTNCNFMEGVLVGSDATFINCSFNSDPDDKNLTNAEKANGYSDHYALWIESTGTVKIDGCHFNNIQYGGIKSTYGDTG